MTRALAVEIMKMRRSNVIVSTTVLMVLLIPLMALGLFSVAINGGTGALADKAAAFLIGEGWVGYLGVVKQIAAVGVFLGGGVVVTWTFGREHMDRTLPSLFALPVSRAAVAGAKSTILAIWVGVTAFLLSWGAFAVGALAGVSADDASVIWSGLGSLFLIAVSGGLLSLTLGLVASVGRGYLAAFGVLILIVAAGQILVVLGTGEWFPYAIPGLIAIAGTEGAPTLSWAHIALAPVLVGVCLWLTIRWWQNAEVV